MKFKIAHYKPQSIEVRMALAKQAMKMARERGKTITFDEALTIITNNAAEDRSTDKVYLSEDGVYQAVVKDADVPPYVTPMPGEMVWLSIKRVDREPIDENHWRILQEIKNAVLGPEVEAVETYPAESRLTDTANQYHLWAFKKPMCVDVDDFDGSISVENVFPFGMFNGRNVDYNNTPGANTKQRGVQ